MRNPYGCFGIQGVPDLVGLLDGWLNKPTRKQANHPNLYDPKEPTLLPLGQGNGAQDSGFVAQRRRHNVVVDLLQNGR